MVMRTLFERTISESFVIDEKRVRSLAGVLQHYAGEPSISATCADDATRSFENIEELFEYENPINRRITSLDMDSYGSELKEKPHANIKFATHQFDSTPGIRIRVSGPEEQALIAKRQLDEIAEGSRPWHSRVSKGELPPFGWVGSCIFVLVGGVIYIIFISTPTDSEVRVRLPTLGVWLGVISVLVVHYGTKILFPSAVFLIGQEKTRHKTKEWAQRIVIGTIATTTLAWLVSLAVR